MKIKSFSKHVSLTTALALSCLVNAPVSFAEEKFEDILQRAQELRTQGKFSQAMNELSWATKELEKQHLEKLQSFFPKAVGDLAGGEFESNSALGLITLERPYSGSGVKLKVSLLGSSQSEGAAARGMGAFAGLAGMAAMMGGQGTGTDSVRIKGARAVIRMENSQAELTLPLSSGMTLQVERQSGKPTKEQLVAVAESVDTAGLEAYIQAK